MATDSAYLRGVLKHAPGGAIQATKATKAKRGAIEGYLVTFGNPRDSDLQGEYFTENTNFCLSWFLQWPALYHHGLDGKVGLKSIGVIKNYAVDDMGIWVATQLNMADEYAKAVYEMVQAKSFGWSSGSVEHLVKVENSGEIKVWPIIEGSITPTPAQPGKTTVYPVKSISLGALNMALKSADWTRELEAQLAQADPLSQVENTIKSYTIGDNEMPYSSYRDRQMVRSVLASYGIKADPEEIEAVAADVAPLLEDDAMGSYMTDDVDLATMSSEEFDAYMADLEDDDDAMMYDDEAMMYDPYMMDDESIMMDDEALMYDDDPIMAGLEDDAMMYDDEDALMADFEEDAMMQDDEEAIMGYRSRRRPRKSYDPVLSEVRKLRRQVKSLEMSEYPGERGVGFAGKSIQITDQADRPGAYEDAFKAYLRVGLAGLYDNQKYNLFSRKDNFGPATMKFDNTSSRVKAFTSGSEMSVGFAVPPDWVNELNKNILADANMAKECATRTTSSDRVIIPNLVTDDARRAYVGNVRWPGETPAAGSEHRADEFNVSQLAIPIHVMLTSYTVSNSALEDVGFDLQAEINQAMAEQVAIAYEELIWGGDGIGKLEGVVNNTDVTGAASTAVSSVGGYVAAGSTTEITSGDVIWQMLYNLPPAYRRNAKWYANSNTMYQIKRLKDGDGNYLWGVNDADRGLNNGMPTEILSRPIVFNEFADDIAANGFPLVLADLSRGYTIAQRVEFSVRRFDEVRADNDQVLFIGRARVGGQVTQPAAFKVLKMAAS